jgi:hypothetical protein
MLGFYPQSGVLSEAPFRQALVWYANIRLGWKCRPVANSRAFYNTELITVVKRFLVQAFCQACDEGSRIIELKLVAKMTKVDWHRKTDSFLVK